MKKIEENIKVDAIIPWVNGNDKNWQKKLNEYSDIKIDFNKKKESIRFNSIGEIDIAIKSIIKHAPFFDNIYLITDDQTPDSFDELQQLANLSGINLEIIDHNVIFRNYEEYLPCFNSTSIITLLYRIPNLAEHFVLFNDDTFIMKKTVKEDFFMKELPILRGAWKKYYEDQKLRTFYNNFFNLTGIKKKTKKPTLKKAMQTGAKLANDRKNVYLRRFHTPISMRKSILEQYFEANKEILKNNIKYRFRDNDNQFITETLANHLEIKNNTYHYTSNIQLTYFRSYKILFITKLKLFWFSINKKKIFMTFQSLEMADKKNQKFILEWINRRIK